MVATARLGGGRGVVRRCAARGRGGVVRGKGTQSLNVLGRRSIPPMRSAARVEGKGEKGRMGVVGRAGDGVVAVATSVLGPAISATTLLFVIRIVMSWYPEIKGEEFPWSLAYTPTEPFLSVTRQFIGPVNGVDITPIVWVALLSFANETLVGPQGILILMSRKDLFSPHCSMDLRTLQRLARADPSSYASEVAAQCRQYSTLLPLVSSTPLSPPPLFVPLSSFVSHTLPACVDVKELEPFSSTLPSSMLSLLETSATSMDPPSRRALASAVLLLHSRGTLPSSSVLPLCFRLFRCRDAQLRSLASAHAVSSLAAEKEGRVRSAVSAFLHRTVTEEEEGPAKKCLAVVMALYRKGAWKDSRAVGIIAAAVDHPSGAVVRAICKFFLGQDEEVVEEDSDEDEEENDDEGKKRVVNHSRDDVYRATKLGTLASKKRKQKRLKRSAVTARRAERRAEGTQAKGFTAIQLLLDPQGFAEKLFKRLAKGNERFEVKLTLMQVISRTIGVHQLLLLNIYPLLQRYMQPHQREVTVVLAALVQACHVSVPPDALEPVMRHLLDNFVSDKSRSEVMTVGIKTIREMAVRCPLILNEDILSDLVEYKKHRDKGVNAAARSLIMLYRDLAPHMLHKRERGRGADMTKEIAEFGHLAPATRVSGAELLECEERGEAEGDEDSAEDAKNSDEEGSDCDSGEKDGDSGDGGEGEDGIVEEEEKSKLRPQADSLRSLKRQLKDTNQGTASANAKVEEDLDGPIEHMRILSNEDFKRIKRLRAEQAEGVLASKHGLQNVNMASDRKVDPDALAAPKYRGHDKQSRLASVMKGREDREQFGSAAGRRQKKTGGLSNREKLKTKILPKGALNKLARSRAASKKRKKRKQK